MRYLVVLTMSCVVLAAIAGTADCAGVRVVGKEECVCNPLVARGIVPDPLNTLKEAVTFPQVGPALDQIAAGVKDLIGQFGAPPSNGATAAVAPEEPKELKEKPSLDEKPAKEEKPTKELVPPREKKKKPVKQLKKSDRKTKKPVKQPPKAT